jgi:hypothetical protein
MVGWWRFRHALFQVTRVPLHLVDLDLGEQLSEIGGSRRRSVRRSR